MYSLAPGELGKLGEGRASSSADSVEMSMAKCKQSVRDARSGALRNPLQLAYLCMFVLRWRKPEDGKWQAIRDKAELEYRNSRGIEK